MLIDNEGQAACTAPELPTRLPVLRVLHRTCGARLFPRGSDKRSTNTRFRNSGLRLRAQVSVRDTWRGEGRGEGGGEGAGGKLKHKQHQPQPHTYLVWPHQAHCPLPPHHARTHARTHTHTHLVWPHLVHRLVCQAHHPGWGLAGAQYLDADVVLTSLLGGVRGAGRWGE